MDPFGVGSAELVAGSFTLFLEGVCKSCQGQSCHAFFMPEAKNKIYPLHMAPGVTADSLHNRAWLAQAMLRKADYPLIVALVRTAEQHILYMLLLGSSIL